MPYEAKTMSINLGLSRVLKLLEHIGNPQRNFKVIHVAGTNGKGSVCSYLTSVLQQRHQVGKFTTPHLIHITDSITVNSTPIPVKSYDELRNSLESLNKTYDLECTEFELLTCTALKYFNNVQCDMCVIEVGLGGRLDATNAISGHDKLACAITKIALDHESILGNTLTEIAAEKAGIITEGTELVIVDNSNDKSVLDVIKQRCKKIGSSLVITRCNEHDNVLHTESWGPLKFDKIPLNGGYQIFNLDLAISILDSLQRLQKVNITNSELKEGLCQVSWPGRLQNLYLCASPYSKDTLPILLDGAHNGNAANELAKYLRKQYGDQPLTFVIAVTQGKNIASLLSPIIRPYDNVIITEFGGVKGMPWITAMDSTELSDIVKKEYTKNVEINSDLDAVIKELPNKYLKSNRPIVACGSLYLCGQLLNIHFRNIGSERTAQS